ncbi:hydroxyisourate hydrolase [Jiangella endophytica]|uniref:hydroxyisourate hydrolase n=1 Tax=Jiangella endophytica TaxID=1623398 RepID=UPI000E34D792|nr:hydroxyisourate hydrolase [Jiangella endophytica]
MSATVSTHVLDAAAGRPAIGVPVVLTRWDGTVLANGVTDADGRVPALADAVVHAGDHRITFATGVWFARTGCTGFYPEVVVAFTVADGEHHHVPLLLAPYAYSTYRGS